jgi:hypothetical protein
MTRSDDRSESQERRRSRVASFRRGGTAMTGKGRERAVKKGSDNNGHRERERQRPTGLGARATADMAGKRPLCVLGPMMSALTLWSFPVKRKGRKKANRRHRCHAYAHPHVGMTCLLIFNFELSTLNLPPTLNSKLIINYQFSTKTSFRKIRVHPCSKKTKFSVFFRARVPINSLSLRP